jgi:hypothetical protein
MLTLSLRASRRLAAALAAAHLGAFAAALRSAAEPLPCAAAACLLAASGRRTHRRYASLTHPGAVATVGVSPDLTVSVTLRDGTRADGRVLQGSHVAGWLTVVRWLPAGGSRARAVVLAPDSADPESLRRLRVLLRWTAI